jgi:hypothetical protein
MLVERNILDRAIEILDLIEITTPTHDSFLFELRAAIEDGDKGRIVYWTGQIAKYVGELTSEINTNISWNFV